MLTAYIAMGANLPSPAGSPEVTLAAAAERLSTIGSGLRRSSLYRTEPVGLRDQPSFMNAVVAVEIPRLTAPKPQTLLDQLLEIEQAFGRDRRSGVVNGPRTLDLDLLLIDDLVLSTPQLTLPHPRLAERAFVLVPLAEIAPNLQHPTLNKSIAELLEQLSDKQRIGVRMESSDWPELKRSSADTIV